MRALRGSNAAAVIAALNPIIRGWAAYYRGVVSSKTFARLDNYLWQLTYSGPNAAIRKAKELDHPPILRQVQQVQERPMGVRRTAMAQTTRRIPHLVKFAWTPIVRHQMVKARRLRTTPP